ncbi:hypothetical protein BCR33DRAFT_724308 [Rhizoclosmatium globosum]|uniref:Nucleotide-diphospho-sugar transferase n=1 Tax=Rhizoclosmatium globosum TaxID=329046 RepID=A0A1Y2B7H2_9FUNG|nr:hypothetical protein BCR33DRAFT_724308 [Rhizoclosmatium globosum]|eukprot:ORY30490.1 hypothetical protein BCR33DRAFT_724308 [Rhizoclosmatium globosum]
MSSVQAFLASIPLRTRRRISQFATIFLVCLAVYSIASVRGNTKNDPVAVPPPNTLNNNLPLAAQKPALPNPINNNANDNNKPVGPAAPAPNPIQNPNNPLPPVVPPVVKPVLGDAKNAGNEKPKKKYGDAVAAAADVAVGAGGNNVNPKPVDGKPIAKPKELDQKPMQYNNAGAGAGAAVAGNANGKGGLDKKKEGGEGEPKAVNPKPIEKPVMKKGDEGEKIGVDGVKDKSGGVKKYDKEDGQKVIGKKEDDDDKKEKEKGEKKEKDGKNENDGKKVKDGKKDKDDKKEKKKDAEKDVKKDAKKEKEAKKKDDDDDDDDDDEKVDKKELLKVGSKYVDLSQINQDQIRFLDWLNGEEMMDASDPDLFGGSLLTIMLDLPKTFLSCHAWAMDYRSSEYNRTDFLLMGTRARALRIAYTLLYDRKDLHPQLEQISTPKFNNPTDTPYVKHKKLITQLKAIVKDLTKLMYPWIPASPKLKSIRAIQKYAQGVEKENERGIIFSTGRGHFELAVHAITALRNVLGCDLPIEVHHMGPNDLDKHMLQAFNAMPNVRTVDVWDFWGTEARNLRGWAIKPFALLASSFQKVMFLDADAVFIQNPDLLFTNSKLFAKYGQLFYNDRTITGYEWCYNWFTSFVPSISRYTNSLRFMKKDTVHEMESGVVVIDKTRTGVLHGLLTTAKMNMQVERDGITYSLMHGDKESYWMSWELARVPYRFSRSYGGTIGYKNEKGAVCGGLFHTDEYLKPLWWNGGVVANKHYNKDQGYLKYEYAAYDLAGKDIKWDWETATTPFCLSPKFPEQKVIITELTPAEKGITEKLVELYKEIIRKGWREYFKDTYGIKFD